MRALKCSCSVLASFSFFSFALALGASPSEHFSEVLKIRPLRDGKVVSTFLFTSDLRGAPRDPASLAFEDEPQHYKLFPLALGQILREYAVSELHLTLNSGNWDYDRWGYPDEQGVGTGAELWVWMAVDAPENVERRWTGIRNALAGSFCASLGSLDVQRTASPMRTFLPRGSLPNLTHPHQLRHATMPSERVCTENLTPFLKLLPCKALSGIASLLNPHRLFDADWHGLGVHVSWHPERGVEIVLAFQAVFDPLRYSMIHSRDWSFRSLFDRTITRSCPVSSSSRVLVTLPEDKEYVLRPEPSAVNESHATFEVTKSVNNLDIAMEWPHRSAPEYSALSPLNPPLTPLSIRRTLKGSTQDRGRLAVVITNNHAAGIRTLYLEAMPWLLQFYIHTLRVQCDGTIRDDLISNISFTPSMPSVRPTTFQCVLDIPPRSSVHLRIDVTKTFLRYTEHPPDAQRGWDLPPAVLVPLGTYANASAGESFLHLQRMYTPALLVDLATPDFSMPYNVIILSCSLVAFIFGSMFNLLTRKFVVVRVQKDERDQVEQK